MAAKPTPQRSGISVMSPAFRVGERIPTKYTADGRDLSRPLEVGRRAARHEEPSYDLRGP